MMAPLLRCGFEMASRIELDASSQSGAWTLDFPTGRRAGTFAIRNLATGNNGFAANWQLNVPGAATEWYVRFSINASGTKSRRIDFGAVTTGVHCYLELGGSATITARDNAGNSFGSTTTPLTTTHLIEMRYLRHSSTGIFQLKIDGVMEINFSGNTASTNSGGLAYMFVNTQTENGRGQTIDDVGFNDTTGSEHNSWLGDGYITMLIPNGDAGTNQWTPSTGSSHYAVVDERASNDDTDYLQSSTSGDKEQLDTTTFTLAAGEEITMMQPVLVAKRVAADTPLDLEPGVLAGSTEDFSAAHTLTTSYKTYRGDFYTNNPDDSQMWEQADMDGVKVVFRNA